MPTQIFVYEIGHRNLKIIVDGLQGLGYSVFAMTDTIQKRLEAELAEAENKAWDSLARYKFQMFGYWAAIWVHINRIGGFKRSNPWTALVKEARNAR